MTNRFEETGILKVQPGRGRKRVTPVRVNVIEKDIDVQSETSEFGNSRVRTVSQETGYSYSTIRKVLRKLSCSSHS
ncbi:hypothetical protein TNCT_715771 [Trichonephila clavata]|uniref:Uncharacterized protein n=1 Tax=Trichonephila clavata TaxID=2740835 RepID=A0A8X6FEA0_TRICU|nr:hypothetical protein TNCT_715771 [Trichonephila clavata]